MGCRMLIWASDSVFEHPYDHTGMQHEFRGRLVKRGKSTKAYRTLSISRPLIVTGPSNRR